MVAEDVWNNGKVVIKEGTLTVGVVKHTRREGAFSAPLFDKPARLSIELDEIRDERDRPISVLARIAGSEKKIYHFTRANTKVEPNEEVTKGLVAVNGIRTTQFLVDVVRGAHSVSELDDSLITESVMELARVLRLGSTAELVRTNRLVELAKFAALIAKPGLAALLATPHVVSIGLLAVRSVKEILRIGRQVPGFFNRKLGGRNISAPMGLEFSVFVE